MTRATSYTPRKAMEMRAPVHVRTIVAFVVVMLSGPIVVGESFGQGFEATLGTGIGSGTIMCSACTHAGNMGGSTLTMQFADRTSPHLRIGSTLDWWWHSSESPQRWERQIWDITAVVFYYPWTLRRGFFIGGGPSYSMVLATATDTTSLTRHGWGAAMEMGYDIAPRSLVSLTPFLEYSYAWVGNIDYPLGTNIPFARGWKHEVVSLGLGITLHERLR